MHAAMHGWWGKARPDYSGGRYLRCLPLPLHSLDVAAAGIEALQRMPSLARVLAKRLTW